MPVRVQVESRDNEKVLLFWKPSDISLVKAYNVYTSLEREGVYTKRVSNLLNKAGETGSAPKKIRSFYRQGAVTLSVSVNSYIAADKEFYVKVTEVYKDNTEELITVAPFRYVRLPGRASTIIRNIDFDRERGILGWDEENNTYKRLGTSLLLEEIDEKHALDVKLQESLVKITNNTDTDSNPIPISISRTSDPVVLRKSVSVTDGPDDVFDSLNFTPDSDKKYGIRDIKISSSNDIKYYLKYNTDTLDQGHLIAQDTVHTVFSGDYFFDGAVAGGDLILEITSENGTADVFCLVILERLTK